MDTTLSLCSIVIVICNTSCDWSNRGVHKVHSIRHMYILKFVNAKHTVTYPYFFFVRQKDVTILAYGIRKSKHSLSFFLFPRHMNFSFYFFFQLGLALLGSAQYTVRCTFTSDWLLLNIKINESGILDLTFGFNFFFVPSIRG